MARHITNTRRIKGVMLNGRWLLREYPDGLRKLVKHERCNQYSQGTIGIYRGECTICVVDPGGKRSLCR